MIVKFIEFVDLFAGAGGVTTGIEQATVDGVKVAVVIAAVNHDPVAIASHKRNHPDTVHFIDDIRKLDVTRLHWRSADSVHVLHASLECTNFSVAKGGQSRDEDSRTLADEMDRYILHLQPDYVTIENVWEFKTWGPLVQKRDKQGNLLFDRKGKPVMYPDPMHKGKCFNAWIERICSYGYVCDYRMMNSADYGEHTSRKRLYMLFARDGFPVVWPEPTHCKSGTVPGLEKWLPVRECLDFSDKGNSIFAGPERKKALSDKTYTRILAGLEKFVRPTLNPHPTFPQGERVVAACGRGSEGVPLAEKAEFLKAYYSSGMNCTPISEPAATLRTNNCMAFVNAEFIEAAYGNGNHVHGTDKPCNTITAVDHHRLVSPEFLINYLSEAPRSLDECHYTITTENQSAVVNAEFMMGYYKSGENVSGMDEPCRTVTTKDRHAVVCAEFCAPTPTLPREREREVAAYAGNVKCFLMNPQFGNKGGAVDDPCFTLIAKMDKKPPYLVEAVADGERYLAIAVDDSDSVPVRKIKAFMAQHGIIDIKMRMLKVPELKRIQGFPEDYVLLGSQTDQKKFIGNSVTPGVMRRWVECLFNELKLLKKIA